MKKPLLSLFFGFAGLAYGALPPREAPTLVSQPLRLKSGKAFGIQIMKGWELLPAAEGLGSPRFMAWGPDKRLYVCDRRQAGDNAIGRIHALWDFDKASGRFKSRAVFAKGLRNPNNLAFYQGRLYAATTDKLLRFPFPKGEPETLAKFPDY